MLYLILLCMGTYAYTGSTTTYEQNHVTLNQNSFTYGPVICDQDHTTYTFSEDVVFDPVVDSTYGEFASTSEFTLGFFAAIIICADNVEIDLNDHHFSASESFIQRQRFFSLIELGSSPFIAKAGPFEFPNANTGFVPATNVHIHDGDLGRTSHSSIHGNNAEGVLVRRVNMMDFEVSGFHCNGCLEVELNRLVVGPSLSNVPHNPRLSQAQQAVRHCKRLLQHEPESLETTVPVAPVAKTLGAICDELEEEVAYALANPDSTAAQQFANDDPSAPDGSAIYGIAVVGRPDHGPIVGDFHKAQHVNEEWLDDSQPELIEWILAEEGQSCSQKCSLGCSNEDFLEGSRWKIRNSFRHIFEVLLDEDCELDWSSSAPYPYIDDDTCVYTSGGVCEAVHSDRRRLCPCKTGLAKYEELPLVVNNFAGTVEEKCGSGFVNIRGQQTCQRAAEELDADYEDGTLTGGRPTCYVWNYHSHNRIVRFTNAPEDGGMPLCVRPFSSLAEVESHWKPTVELYRVTVKDLSLNAHELPAVKVNDNIIRGPFGGLLDHRWVTENGILGMWEYNALAAAKFGLCRVTLSEDYWWQKMTCDADLWAPLENFMLGQETLAEALGGDSNNIGCGGDGMAHVNKGAVGIRIEDIPYANLQRVTVKDMQSIGNRPADSMCNDLDDDHMRGSDVYGLVMGGVDKVYAQRVRVSNLESTDGMASAVAFNGRMPNWDHVHWISVKNVEGAVEPSMVADGSDLSCPFSGEKPARLKWKNVGDGPACAYATIDMCEVGGTITGQSCDA